MVLATAFVYHLQSSTYGSPNSVPYLFSCPVGLEIYRKSDNCADQENYVFQIERS